jgi:hypothetical protein
VREANSFINRRAWFQLLQEFLANTFSEVKQRTSILSLSAVCATHEISDRIITIAHAISEVVHGALHSNTLAPAGKQTLFACGLTAQAGTVFCC